MTRSGQKSASLDTFRTYVDPEKAAVKCDNSSLLLLLLFLTNFFVLFVCFFCQQSYPEQSLLLLVTGALGLRVLHSPLLPILPVFNTFKVTSGSSSGFFFFFFFEAASTSCEHPDERYTVKIKPLKRLKGHFRFGPVRLQDNLWALEWFWDFLACGSGRLSSFSQEVTEELEHSAGERVEMFRSSY